jgi:hypothetical protein
MKLGAGVGVGAAASERALADTVKNSVIPFNYSIVPYD